MNIFGTGRVENLQEQNKIGRMMMKGIIIQGEKYYTYLKKIFVSINNIQRDYNWLITNHECYPQNKKYEERLSGEYCWLSGNELTEMVGDEDFQWIWGVLSAFSTNLSKQDILKYDFPKPDSVEIWKNPVSIQHPLAEIEIIPWDSSLTVITSKRNDIIDLLQSNGILMEDLEEYNEGASKTMNRWN